MVLFLFIYLIPSVATYARVNFVSSPTDLEFLVNEIPKGAKVLLVPRRSQVTNIFDYTERMSNPLNPVFLQREDLHLINTAASLPPPFKLDNATRKFMFEVARENSPYFKSCGAFDENDLTCLVAFMQKFDIDFLLMDSQFNPGNQLEWVGSFEGLALYSLR